MARVLTVDDSRAVRTLLVRQLKEWGIEVDEAEDGARGLEKLRTGTYDVVLLDVSMPEMDGPTMLAKLRESGNRTPVLMLTSESKKSIVVDAVKSGIEDYILKPFTPEDLKAKLDKVLKAGTAAPAPRKSVDVLLVDDMENVHQKLRALLPQTMSMDACPNAAAALQHAREHAYRLVIVDSVIPDVNSVALMNQLRALQPRAMFLSLCLRTTENAQAQAKKDGFDGVLFKPFTQEVADELVAHHFETNEVVEVEGNSLRIAEYAGREDGVPRYYRKLTERLTKQLPTLAEACFDAVEINAAKLRLHQEHTLKLLIAVRTEAARLGIGVRVRGPKELGKLMAEVADTSEIPFEVLA